jgi:hypothetical protein
MQRILLSIRSREAFVLIACLVIFAAYYPAAVWVHRSHVPIERPKGGLVELVSKFEDDGNGRYQARVFSNWLHLRATLYEDLAPLQEVDIIVLPSRPPSWRFFKMPPGTNPNTNGRRYYLVQH